MVRLNCVGKVTKGPLAGWYVQVQAIELPKGFLVSRARNAVMDQTVILDGIFPDQGELDAFFAAQAPHVDWEGPTVP